MSESAVAIVGSGIVGTTLAYLLTRRGYDVTIFEKGPDYPYPHGAQFSERIVRLYDNPAYRLPADLQDLAVTGDYAHDLDRERVMVVGGQATQWKAITLRLRPNDLRTRTRYDYGTDWPLSYDELEPYYCRAETLLGVSGTDTDNPFAAPRSRPYPLPPFDLAFDDTVLGARLKARGLVLHTTPQARTRHPYDGRAACQNFGICRFCPVGARYSPNHHLGLALATGRCHILSNTSVRQILVDRTGTARGVVFRANHGRGDQEHAARIVVVAAGAIESARLLLLSTGGRRADGLGNAGGQVGRHLIFHHLWRARLRYRERLAPGRFGGSTGQSQQFLDPEGRGRHGGVKVEFSAGIADLATFYPKYDVGVPDAVRTGADVVQQMTEARHWRLLVFHSESVAGPDKHVRLAEQRDRFGDPFAHVHYENGDFDHQTYRFARRLFEAWASATGASDAEMDPVERFDSGQHHLGTCRMGRDERDSVVDRWCRVHGTSNLFVVGGANFPSPGAVNPTLTMVALAIRLADHVGTLLSTASKPR